MKTLVVNGLCVQVAVIDVFARTRQTDVEDTLQDRVASMATSPPANASLSVFVRPETMFLLLSAVVAAVDRGGGLYNLLRLRRRR